MRKPNGYGSIKKLSGNRRRPFVFVITKDGKQKAMGYFVLKLKLKFMLLITIKRTIKFYMGMKQHFQNYSIDGFLFI